MPDLEDLLKRWPSLPDEAVVPTKVVAAVTSLSERTVRNDQRFERVELTDHRYGFRVGTIRKILSGTRGAAHIGAWQPIGDAANAVTDRISVSKDHAGDSK